MAIGVAGVLLLSALEPAEPAIPDSEPKAVRAEPNDLAAPMQFSLDSAGTLHAEGSIEPGTAARLALELQAVGTKVKVISLNSPGGSLNEAIALGEQIRFANLSAEVADGAVCASSCPLFFAGGTTRSAGSRAAIGVHQFYAAPVPGLRGAENAMSDAQLTTARITRYLAEMGVDPAAWLHALDTPPSSLYYYSSYELAEYGFVTSGKTAPLAQKVDKVARLFE
ncbi:MAG: ATP-dependent Clp protease proteolytic subunit [Rhizobiaceae bacterium]|nr:ATP-dependent Clp protease proteolytic subunit [Rhizobiaceae bacterium]